VALLVVWADMIRGHAKAVHSLRLRLTVRYFQGSVPHRILVP
jgi:hypothetical protein